MNVKEYIGSGIVESYVLGLATAPEQAEFEQLCAQYPDLVEARNSFELALEAQLMSVAVAPPAFLKQKIEQTLLPGTEESNTYDTPAQAPVRQMNVWKLAAAACFIGLLGAGIWAYTANQKYNDAVAQQTALQQQLQQKNTELAALMSDANTMQSPGVKMAALKGTATAPQALTTIFWDSTNKAVWLLVNNLPQAPTDKQYQLWALLDGKPIDLGMLEVTEKRLLVKMKNVQAAQAFAITLEEKGGSPTPKGQMYVLGNL